MLHLFNQTNSADQVRAEHHVGAVEASAAAVEQVAGQVSAAVVEVEELAGQLQVEVLVLEVLELGQVPPESD